MMIESDSDLRVVALESYLERRVAEGFRVETRRCTQLSSAGTGSTSCSGGLRMGTQSSD
jgi:hypothetical protein